MYHYVSELPPDAGPIRRNLTVLPENFRSHLEYLTETGYQTITLFDLYMHLTQGRQIPDKPVILTFDDGYLDAYTVVFPLLQQYDSVGTFFLLTAALDYENPNYITWAMAEEMAAAGMEIQAHGRDHIDLRGLPHDMLVHQIAGARQTLEEHIGQPVQFFCYPSGQFDSDVINVVYSSGYLGAVTTLHGRSHTADNLFTLRRIRIQGGDQLGDFVYKLDPD
jgi:peptidoglycan/xylan/chitin deacetylase (PgdA/CDA1 family)